MNNLRQSQRTSVSFPIQINFGSQISLQGQLKDISLKSAFIKIKSSIYMQPNDDISFVIKRSSDSVEEPVQGYARISRVSAGEGIAIYFTKMDESSSNRLKELIELR